MEQRFPVPIGGGLTLPKVVAVSEAEQTQISNRWNTLEKVLEDIEKWGFKDATQPEVECPAITPEILLTPDPKQYTVLYSHQLQWFNYANKLRARIESEILQVDAEMKDISATMKKQIRRDNENKTKGEKIGTNEMEDEIEVHSRYRELRLRLVELKQYKIELGCQVEELENNMKVISRQVEIRKEENNGGRNAQNMPGRGNSNNPSSQYRDFR